jgi:hypothetical protein
VAPSIVPPVKPSIHPSALPTPPNTSTIVNSDSDNPVGPIALLLLVMAGSVLLTTRRFARR